jgi:catalase (peroxidase I)
MENKSTKSLMMLTTDMAMITDKAFKVYSQLYVSTFRPVITVYLTLEFIVTQLRC